MLTRIIPAFLLVFIGAVPVVSGQDQNDEAAAEELLVATKVAEPFVIENEGELSGISIDLWNAVAEEIGVSFRYEVVELDELIEGVGTGRFDAGIGAISITAEREELLDLTHGFFDDGLGIVTRRGANRMSWARALSNLFSTAFISAVGALALLLTGVGIVVWLVERRKNTEQFNKHPAKGLGDGFWFAAVTMTTVGYGDKAPVSLFGKLVALIWMFASIIIISAFTGAIASSLTASQISGAVRGPEDLRSVKVGALEGSATMPALRDRGASGRPYPTVTAGLEALASDEISAFVHDHAILEYRTQRDFPGEFSLLESKFEVSVYGIALPSGSSLREEINRAVLEIRTTPEWRETIQRYLGG